VAALVAERVEKTSGQISAKRLLPAARAAGYAGSDRNFRRLVAAARQAWRREHHRGRRPAVWSPGEHLVIDWGSEGGLHVLMRPIQPWNGVAGSPPTGFEPVTFFRIRVSIQYLG
jgi:hypothetical protein